jgi:predicted nucleic acid-binding protein
MSGSRATYLDSSAIVKLVVDEAESTALRTHLAGRRPLLSSALARTEVMRALLPFGSTTVDHGLDVLGRIDLIRISDRALATAGELQSPDVPSLDALHLATAQLLGDDVAQIVTYDKRMADAARALGHEVAAPS